MIDACESGRNGNGTDFDPLQDAFLPFGQLFPPGEKPFQGRVMRSLVTTLSEWAIASCVFLGRPVTKSDGQSP